MKRDDKPAAGIPQYQLRAQVHGPDDTALEVWQMPSPATPQVTQR